MADPASGRILRAGACAVTLGPALHVLRYGYRFGTGDQDEFLPLLLHRLRPELLENDWFVGLQSAGFGVRTPIAMLLEWPSRLIGVEAAVLLVYGVFMAVAALALFRLALAVGAHPEAGAVAAVAVMALVPRWTLGGNAIPASMLVPSLAAWALILSATVLALSNRPVRAGLLIGLAGWFQILDAAYGGAAILCGFVLATPRRAMPFAAAALLVAAPVAFLIVRGGMDPAAIDRFSVLARVRAPHHYLPYAFPTGDVVRTGLLAAAGAVALRLRPRRQRHADRVLTGVFALAVGAAALGSAAAFLPGMEAVLLLQPFKPTLLTGAAAVAGLASLLPATGRIGDALVILGTLGGLVALGTVATGGRIAGKPPLDPPAASDGVAAWAQTETARTAVIAVPPSWSGFRYAAGRSVVATFKAYPFHAGGMRAWYDRLRAMSPGVLPDDPSRFDWRRGGAALPARLDAAWESMEPTAAVALARRFGATHVVRSRPFPPATVPDAETWGAGLVEVARPAGFVVYAVVR